MFKSFAEWPKGQTCLGDRNITSDNHESQDQARAVCHRLERDGWAGEREVFPVRTWIEPA